VVEALELARLLRLRLRLRPRFAEEDGFFVQRPRPRFAEEERRFDDARLRLRPRLPPRRALRCFWRFSLAFWRFFFWLSKSLLFLFAALLARRFARFFLHHLSITQLIARTSRIGIANIT